MCFEEFCVIYTGRLLYLLSIMRGADVVQSHNVFEISLLLSIKLAQKSENAISLALIIHRENAPCGRHDQRILFYTDTQTSWSALCRSQK